MKPGRELDIAIAEKVFGAKVENLSQKHGWRIDFKSNMVECNDFIKSDAGIEGSKLKPFSTDIAAAWKVLEKFSHTRLWFNSHFQKWICEWARPSTPPFVTIIVSAAGDTASHAICLAALEAVKPVGFVL